MASSIPVEMQAVVIQEGKTAAVVKNPVPTPKDNQVLVKVAYTALNPIDWKLVDFMGGPGEHLGCELTGTIVSIGGAPKNDKLVVGQVVSGMCEFSAQDVGTHADYAVMESDFVYDISRGPGPAEAASIPIGIATAAVGLYTILGAPFPPPNKIATPAWILIYGGSSAVGMMAIQLEKLAGYKVVSTASKANHELVRKLGADVVFEYRDANACIKSISEITSDKLCLAYDAIASQSSFEICINALVTNGGSKLAHTMPMPEEMTAKAKERGIETKMVLLGTMFANPTTRAMGAELFSLLPELIEKHGLQHPPVVVKECTSLNDILSGLDELKQGRFSASKVVMKLQAECA